jgi:3-oxoacyl-[acyl-carrier protein] reductase
VISERRVALINNTSFYVGPPLARFLAARGHDLVIGDPHDGLVDELTALGARVEVVTGVYSDKDPRAAHKLVDAGLKRFGRIDSAASFNGRIITGRFLNSTNDDLKDLLTTCVEAPYNFLKAVLPSMVERNDGQVLIITSASGARPTPGAPLYSSMRAAATMMAKNAAQEMARHKIQINSVGTNFMDFPEFLRASNATTPEGRAKVESQVPLGRLGTLDEFASFCMPYLDGTSRFTTGQFVAYAGGWA